MNESEDSKVNESASVDLPERKAKVTEAEKNLWRWTRQGVASTIFQWPKHGVEKRRGLRAIKRFRDKG